MRRFALLLGVTILTVTTPAVAQNCDGFVDVLASNPFCPDVTWMKTYGVTKGCDATHYCPTDNVSRLQMAAFMHRLGENPAFVNGGNAFGTVALLGTLDNNPLYVIVDSQRAMLVQPAVQSSDGFNPNVVNGMGFNSVAGGIAGATIAGGGGCNPGTGGSCFVQTANQVTGTYGTVSGGSINTAGYLGAVAGGSSNTASGNFSTVAGGSFNTASNTFSTVAGGSSNTAAGAGSFAAGSDANAASDGCFVWADTSTSDPTNCGVANAFVARAKGGFYLITGGTYPAYTGALLNTGSTSWTTLSDRNSKDHIVPVDPLEVLAKVAALPIATWNWKSQDAAIRHMGPMAQDFAAAFGLGETPRGINTVDSEGVALAAIKGLYERTEAALQAKDREIASLREELNAIKAALSLR
jgi:hypothetical protein